ncbi:DUF1800 family protein [Paenibacillus sp. YYML68]|uniref:DUF1800 domain-containing protein n=1 Tax=Paenibacillus sp. YYML68 TaxID=2909250 RepID=UPI002490B3D5|nr:DUF1800 domain-containing protein [Paenibacillus sp. YYML68]
MTWTEADRIHLLKRTTFRITDEELEAAGKLGQAETVRRIVRGEPLTGATSSLPSAVEAFKQVIKADSKPGAQLQTAKVQWYHRMLHTPVPLVEKLTLFWHDHFATNAQKIDNAELMVVQSELFRTYASGDFKELVKRVGRDGAMLIWLDANHNRAGKPNENYARELMELFTLGLGHYSEDDVKEAARAFTGWKVNKRTGSIEFVTKLHDAGTKRVLGVNGPFNDHDVVDILFRQEALSRFVVRKLLLAFGSPSPSEAWLDRLAARFRERYDIGDVMIDMFLSDEFNDPANHLSLVRTPTEYIVWILGTLGRPADGQVAGQARRMGQDLFMPPDVNGWPYGYEWLGSANVLARYTYAEAAAANAVKQRLIPEALASPGQGGAAAWVDSWARHLRLYPLSETTRRVLLSYLEPYGFGNGMTSDGRAGGSSQSTHEEQVAQSGAPSKQKSQKAAAQAREAEQAQKAAAQSRLLALKGLIHLLLISPEAQMK